MSYTDIEATKIDDLLNSDDLVVIDMRDQQSQSLGMLPGALPASDAVIAGLVKKRHQDPPVLVYCYEGNMSRDLCTLIKGLGLSRVYNLAGGWTAWINARA